MPSSSMADGSESTLKSDLEEIYELEASMIENLGNKKEIIEVKVPDRSRQIALIGLVKLKGTDKNLIGGSPESLVRILVGPVKQKGFFGNPSTAADLSNLSLPDRDFNVLSVCESRACKFKLDAAGIEQARSIDWDFEQGKAKFTDYLRGYLATYVQSYRKHGSNALIVYDDKPRPFALNEGAETIHEQMSFIRKRESKLFAYLDSYPENRPENMHDFFYWSLKKLGYEHWALEVVGYRPRSTLSVDHVVIDTSPQTRGLHSVIVFKTIYATHYLAARYQVAAIIEGEEGFGVPGRYLILIDRMLFDDKIGRFQRKLLGSGMKDNMKDRLKHITRKTENR
jgi:hypothetical protein